jgi:twitching motility protein PilT
MQLQHLLQSMIASRASDLHIKVGGPPRIRVDGLLYPLDHDPPSAQDVESWLDELLTERQRRIFELQREVDFSFGIPDMARFRANCFQQRGTLSLAFRHIPTIIPTFSELGLPESIRGQAFERSGLVVVTGPTGVGKSTTLAAIVDAVNTEEAKNIITIEDPIEFLHRDKNCCVNQREVGVDTESFADGLRHILRQDPDIILIGEIRDRDTMETALMAADTGHLVLSTLHTTDTVQTVQRVISFFPPHQHEEIRRSLATNLRAVFSQRLVPRDGGGRVPAVEVMINTATIREYLASPEKLSLIRSAIEEGVTQYGMQTFDQSLMNLLRNGIISEREAIRFATNPGEFALHLKGIEATSDRRWQPVEQGHLEHLTRPSAGDGATRGPRPER